MAFLYNFNPSEIVFKAVQHSDFLQDTYFWLNLTIQDFLNLNDNFANADRYDTACKCKSSH
ncbi:hypothetical protein A1D23_09430 [Chelonobacter oris]|nr:hypothetical protein [Chelonobacter oris]